MALNFQSADRITPLSSSTDQVLIAETSWSWPDVSLPAYDAANIATTTPQPAPAGISDAIMADQYAVFYQHQPRIVEGGLREDGTLVEIPIKTGNAAMNKYAAGPLDLTDGFTVTGSCDGTALLYRMITQMLDPGDGVPVNGSDATAHTLADADLDGAVSVTAIPAAITNPVQVKITPGADAALAGSTASTNIVITGTVQSGRGVNDFVELSETVNYTATEVTASEVKTTDSYFKTVTAITSTDSHWDSSGSDSEVAFTVEDTSKRVVFTPQDSKLAAYWDIEWTKGTVANLYRRVVANQIDISITRTEAILFALTCLGKDARTYQNFYGSTGADATKSSAAALGTASSETYTGWQCELNVNGIRFPLLDSTLTINQNLINSDVISGGRYQESPPVRDGNRECSLTGTVVFSPENDLSQAFTNNLNWRNIQVILRNQPLAGFPWQTVFRFPQGQLRTSPDPASPRNERITQSFELMMFTEDIGGDLEYSIEADYANYIKPRVYS